MDAALFLDFDGTLVEIAERPEAVWVAPGLTGRLARLREELGGALAIVSGRAIATLDEFLAPERFDAAGLHGLEQRVGAALSPCHVEDNPILREWLAGVVRSAPKDLLIEDKGCSVAFHWRTAPHLAGHAAGLALEARTALGTGYRVQEGKAVMEVLPASAGKGGAIRRFMEEPPYRGRRPIFIGDDRTDEDGFDAVNAVRGVSIKIGDGRTRARWRLPSPAELRTRIWQWADSGVDLAGLVSA